MVRTRLSFAGHWVEGIAKTDASSSAVSPLILLAWCTTFLARVLDVISTRLFDGGLDVVLGSGAGVLIAARSRRQLIAATSRSPSSLGADSERRAH